MSDNIVESFLGTLNSRLKNPFFGALIISWSTINWEIVFLVLSFDITNQEKIIILSTQYEVWSLSWNFIPLVILPITSAYLITVYFPKFNAWLEDKHLNKTEETRLENRLPVAEKRVALEKVEVEHLELSAMKKDLERLEVFEEKGKVRIKNLISERNELKSNFQNVELEKKRI